MHPGPLFILVAMRLSPDDRHAIAARAATVYERLAAGAAFRPPTALPPSIGFLRWNQAFAPGDADTFLRRLSWDGFDAASAARASSPSVEPGLEVPDGWTVWLDLICAEATGVRADLLAGRLPRDEGDDAAPFGEVHALILRAGQRALNARVAPAVRTMVTPDVFTAFDRQLLREVGRYADLALYEHFRAFLDSTLPADAGAPVDSRYRTFVEQLLDGGLVRFFTEYAVLARQLATVLACWVDSTAECLHRLHTDRDVLAATFTGGTALGVVTRVDPALSDPHHGRRRVCALTFSTGFRLVYKPRGVRIEHVFSALLRWLNDGLDHPLRELAVLDCGDHGWVEFAAHEPLGSHAEVASYFHRAGALMCLSSVLGARDLHRENLVATCRGPVLVDLEMLLQPARALSPGSGDALAPEGDQAPPPDTCLSTGMLSLIDVTPDGEPHDAGGLRGARTGSLPFPARVWLDCGTDAVHFVERSTFVVAGTHQVLVDDVAHDPGDYADELVKGFSQAYRLLLARRDTLLSSAGPLTAFGACRVRVLPRPTNQYAMLAHLLATPKYQRDGVTSSCAVDALHRGFNRSRTRPDLWPMVIEERRAIGALDIPYFSVRGDGTCAEVEGRAVSVDRFTRSGLDEAHARVRALAPDALDAQVTLLRRALSESVRSTYPAAAGTHRGRPGHADDACVAAAEWVGDALLSRAERTPDGLVWPYRRLVSGPGWRDHHLYDGSVGAALFLSALAVVTGKSGWALAANEALGPIRAHAERWPIDAMPAGEPIGGGNGLGSVVYGLTVVSALRNDRSWLDLARRLAAAMPPRAIVSGPVDIINGAAGAVLSLLALHDVTRDTQVLAAACVFGQHLVDRQVAAGPGEAGWASGDGSRLLGFAHGAAGVAAALVRLSAATGDRVFVHAAHRAYKFVRHQHCPASGNWPIAVSADGAAVGGMMLAWCHGAPGIALSAIVAAGARQSPAVLRGIESALRHVGQWQPAQADHICCGSLGRAEVLLVAGEHLGRADAIEAARVLAMRVIERARRRGHFRLSAAGTDYRVFDPGFFRGLSGIGYQLLRLARPSGLPSIAGFEAPRASLRYCSPVAAMPDGVPVTSSLPADVASTEFTS